MAQTILDDGINVMGSGTPTPPPVTPVLITSPVEHESVGLPFDVTGTAAPGTVVEVLLGAQAGATPVGTPTADGTGAWSLTVSEWPATIGTPTDGDGVSIYAHDDADHTNQSVVVVTASVPAVEGGDEESPAPQAASTRLVQPDTIEPSNYTAAEVKHYLTQHPEDIPDVLARERAGKNRTSIIRAFEEEN